MKHKRALLRSKNRNLSGNPTGHFVFKKMSFPQCVSLILVLFLFITKQEVNFSNAQKNSRNATQLFL